MITYNTKLNYISSGDTLKLEKDCIELQSMPNFQFDEWNEKSKKFIKELTKIIYKFFKI
jgi:hypothetical protein